MENMIVEEPNKNNVFYKDKNLSFSFLRSIYWCQRKTRFASLS